MNTKLTIRLIGYSLIVVWAVWLIGRPTDVGSGDSDSPAARIADPQMQEDLPGNESPGQLNAAGLSEKPPSLVETERAINVRLYIDRMVSTDQGVDQLMNYARKHSDNPHWSTPIKTVINEVIKVAERERFESGDLYVECGGLLCFIHGGLNVDTTLMQLPIALRAASIRGDVRFVTVAVRNSEKYGWVFFIAAPDFKAPLER